MLSDKHVKGVKTIENSLIGVTKRWLQPLNGGSQLIGVLFTVFCLQQFQDFDNCPVSRGLAVRRFSAGVLVVILDSSVFLLFLVTALKPTRQLQQQSLNFHQQTF